MTEIWGTFEELNIRTPYDSLDNVDFEIIRNIEHLRDYGTVGEVFEWYVNPITQEVAELTRIS